MAEPRRVKAEIIALDNEHDSISGRDLISKLSQNPKTFVKLFNLTPSQLENVRAVTQGGGVALTNKYIRPSLENMFGPVLADMIAGAVGNSISGYLIRKIT